ncbi:hypothetical protein JW905_02900 [bacterium]|nr:hypothetical protein [candidate division CSSED10-310 bacterium]
MRCPKCGTRQPAGAVECIKCGVVFAKYREDDVPEQPSAMPPGDPKSLLEMEWLVDAPPDGEETDMLSLDRQRLGLGQARPEPRHEMQSTMLLTKDCPNCGKAQASSNLECPYCGIIFAKYKPKPGGHESEPPPRSEPLPWEPAAPRAGTPGGSFGRRNQTGAERGPKIPDPFPHPFEHELEREPRSYGPAPDPYYPEEIRDGADVHDGERSGGEDPGLAGSLGKLPGILVYPLKGKGVVSLLLFTAVLFGLNYAFCLGSLFRYGIFMGIIMAVIRHSSVGGSGLPTFDLSDFWEGILMPAIRGFAATLMLVLPLVLVAALASGLGLGSFIRDMMASQLSPATIIQLGVAFFICMAVGVILFPAALTVAAINENTFHVMNPLVAFNIIRRIPLDYVIVTGLFVGLYSLDTVIPPVLAGLLGLGPLSMLKALLNQLISLYFWMVIARLFGLMVYLNGYKLGVLQD